MKQLYLLHKFEKVQDILNSRKQHKSNFDLPLSNPLAGLIKCSECNRIMVKRRCAQGDFLYCSTTGCKNIGSYLNRVEEHILQALSNMLSDYEYYVDNYEQETIKEKEIKEQYPEVDYQAQLGLCLSFLAQESKKEGEKKMTIINRKKFFNEVNKWDIYKYLENNFTKEITHHSADVGKKYI